MHGKRIQNPWGCGVLLLAPRRPGSWEESQKVMARPWAGAAQTCVLQAALLGLRDTRAGSASSPGTGGRGSSQSPGCLADLGSLMFCHPCGDCAHAEPCAHALCRMCAPHTCTHSEHTCTSHAHTRHAAYGMCVPHACAHTSTMHTHVHTTCLYHVHTHCAAYSTCMYHIQPE